MRIIDAARVTAMVERLCMESNYYLNADIKKALESAAASGYGEAGTDVLNALLENAELAALEQVAMCQDTGMTIVFAELGQQVVIEGGDLTQAINEGVRRGYRNGFLRMSVVGDPVERSNTGDNTPAVIHYNIISGDSLRITVAPKGFGSENMGALKMLKPSDGMEGVLEFVVETVRHGGQNACPPLIVGVGVGGTMEKAALLAKSALLRSVDERNTDSVWRDAEYELLKRINALGIGPSGLGGRVTAICVNIETFPTHIAGLPVAVNLSCHATRHAQGVL